MKFEDVKVVSIIGTGLMGRGIAQVSAQGGYKVIMRDVSQELLDAAFNVVKKGVNKTVEKGIISEDRGKEALENITLTTDLEKAAKEADLVIEAIPEKVEFKKELFTQLDKLCKDEAIIASNTSTISITDLASSTERPHNFIGTHFFNPVALMKLVEIIKGLLTSDETTEITTEFVSKIGKEAIIVNDSPGFATSRLGLALFLEAHRMLDEGITSVADIDKGMKLGYSHRMGPFETCDLVGLDARLNNIYAMYEATRDPLWKPPQLLKKLVLAGYLGKKDGSKGGYYAYFGLEK